MAVSAAGVHALNRHSALIYVMVIVSAADGAMSDRELRTIGALTKTLPVFQDFEEHRLIPISRECAAMLREPEALDSVLRLVREALPPDLRETAYALALDVALTDRRVMIEEIRILEILRRTLGLDRLVAAAIERGARARYAFVAET